MIVNKLID